MKFLTVCYLGLLLCFCSASAIAQGNICGFDEALTYNLAYDSNFKDNFETNKTLLHKIRSSEERMKSTSGRILTIPVVVHLLHLDNPLGTGGNLLYSDVVSAIDNLNQEFANSNGLGVDVEIQFCLAKRTPEGGPFPDPKEPGVLRVNANDNHGYRNFGMATNGEAEIRVKSLSRYPNDDYLNVWVVHNIYGTGASNPVGNAEPPGSSYLVDGVSIEFAELAENGNSVLTHEIGHYLNLLHTFHGGDETCCPLNDNCLLEGDLICDTPPHLIIIGGCETGKVNKCACDTDCHAACESPECDDLDPNCNTICCPLEDEIVHNYMGLTDQVTCLDRFTQGQREVMRVALRNMRASLLTSLGCLWPCSTVQASFTGSTNPEVNVLQSYDNNSTGATDYFWIVETGQSQIEYFNSEDLDYTFSSPGLYKVCLQASNSDCTNEYCKYIVINGLDPCDDFDLPPCEVLLNGNFNQYDGGGSFHYSSAYEFDRVCNWYNRKSSPNFCADLSGNSMTLFVGHTNNESIGTVRELDLQDGQEYEISFEYYVGSRLDFGNQVLNLRKLEFGLSASMLPGSSNDLIVTLTNLLPHGDNASFSIACNIDYRVSHNATFTYSSGMGKYLYLECEPDEDPNALHMVNVTNIRIKEVSVINAHLEDEVGNEKDEFCIGETIYLDATASTGYEQYRYAWTEWDENGDPINFGFTPVYDGPILSRFNVTDFLWTTVGKWNGFCPDRNYSVRVSLISGKCWTELDIPLTIICCEEYDPDFGIETSDIDQQTYEMTDGYKAETPIGYVDCPVMRTWCIYESDEKEGPYTGVAYFEGENFTYTALVEKYYKVTQRITEPCGDTCFTRGYHHFINEQTGRSDFETWESDECPEACIVTDPCDPPENLICCEVEGDDDQVMLKWDAVLDAIGYELWITWNGDCCENPGVPFFTYGIPLDGDITQQEVSRPPFDCWSWKVKAICENGESGFSEEICMDVDDPCGPVEEPPVCDYFLCLDAVEHGVPVLTGITTNPPLTGMSFPYCLSSQLQCQAAGYNNWQSYSTFIDDLNTALAGNGTASLVNADPDIHGDCRSLVVLIENTSIEFLSLEFLNATDGTAGSAPFEQNCPDPCPPPENLGCMEGEGGLILFWDNIPDAIGYQVEVSWLDPDCCSFSEEPFSTTIYDVIGNNNQLPIPWQPIDCWSWRVRTICENGESDFSEKVCMNSEETCLPPLESSLRNSKSTEQHTLVDDEIRLVQNPVGNWLNLEVLSLSFVGQKISIRTINGTIVDQTRINTQGLTSVPVGHLGPGLYTIEVRGVNGPIVLKFVKT